MATVDTERAAVEDAWHSPWAVRKATLDATRDQPATATGLEMLGVR